MLDHFPLILGHLLSYFLRDGQMQLLDELLALTHTYYSETTVREFCEPVFNNAVIWKKKDIYEIKIKIVEK